MITLVYCKKFQKSFSKQPRKIQEKAMDVLELFEENQYHFSLRRHSLKGKYQTYESIDVTGDVRIILLPQTLEIVDIVDIGTHAQLY